MITYNINGWSIVQSSMCIRCDLELSMKMIQFIALFSLFNVTEQRDEINLLACQVNVLLAFSSNKHIVIRTSSMFPKKYSRISKYSYEYRAIRLLTMNKMHVLTANR